MLHGRLREARFERRGGAASSATNLGKQLTWKLQLIRNLPPDTPQMDKPGSLLALRLAVFDWLGAYSFVLRLAPKERAMLSDTELTLHRDNRAAFREAWTPTSLTHLQHDVYMELKRYFGRSILVAHFFT